MKILKNFVSEQDWILEAGDMLYLPPQIAHWGVAVGDNCMTYSIGFRAPKTQELMLEFLSYLQDNISDSENALYSDPDLPLQNHPAKIDDLMVNKVSAMLQKITWDKLTVADFLGQYLTEPKPDVYFEPAKKLSLAKFTAQLQQKIITLDLKSQMLFTDNAFYLNGEKLTISDNLIACMQDLANQRYLDINNQTSDLQNQLGETLYESYLAGFIGLE